MLVFFFAVSNKLLYFIVTVYNKKVQKLHICRKCQTNVNSRAELFFVLLTMGSVPYVLLFVMQITYCRQFHRGGVFSSSFVTLYISWNNVVNMYYDTVNTLMFHSLQFIVFQLEYCTMSLITFDFNIKYTCCLQCPNASLTSGSKSKAYINITICVSYSYIKG